MITSSQKVKLLIFLLFILLGFVSYAETDFVAKAKKIRPHFCSEKKTYAELLSSRHFEGIEWTTWIDEKGQRWVYFGGKLNNTRIKIKLWFLDENGSLRPYSVDGYGPDTPVQKKLWNAIFQKYMITTVFEPNPLPPDDVIAILQRICTELGGTVAK